MEQEPNSRKDGLQGLPAIIELANGRLTLLEEQERYSPAEWKLQMTALLREEEILRDRFAAEVEAGGVAPLEYLFRTFRCNPFERHCIYLALAVELDSRFEQRFQRLQADGARLPSLTLCLNSFTRETPVQHQLLSAWRKRAEVLTYFFQVTPGSVQGDLSVGLKLDTRMLDFCLSFQSAPQHFERYAQIFWSSEPLADLVLHEKLCDQMCNYADQQVDKSPLLFYLEGEGQMGKRTLVRHYCRRKRRPLLLVDLPALFRQPEGWRALLTAVCREAIIRRAAVAIHGFEACSIEESGTSKPPVEEFPMTKEEIPDLLHRLATGTDTLFLLSKIPFPPETPWTPWSKYHCKLELPGSGDRILLWQHELKKQNLAEEISLDALAVKFSLSPGQLHEAVEQAARTACWEGKAGITGEILHQACRQQLSHSLGKKATLVKAAYTWEDLILPIDQKRQLKNACAQVEYRHRVYEQWGFGGKIAYGRGLSMLFSGPPGTGKTMAAQVIANRLQLELYKVDISGVMSKYIGETEKQLGEVFDEVKKSQSILFFDEADALFGKRSETKDAQDRYANVQTSYLLQKMEEYEGIVILASNYQQNFDEAFKRRIKFIIDFPLPDREHREMIWRSVMPKNLPLSEDVDYDFLARSFELSGSSIKNICVSAAFLAAAEETVVGMPQLLTALQAEQHKTGKNVGKEEFGEYYEQVFQYQKQL